MPGCFIMPRGTRAVLLAAAIATVALLPARAQTPAALVPPASTPSASGAPAFAPVAPPAFNTSGPVLRAPAQLTRPFTVAGQRGVLLGLQDGILESWILPVKLLSHLTLEANIQGYTVPIDLNPAAAQIEVRTDRTVLTYAHLGLTVRQIMFSPDEPGPGPARTGPIVLFQFDCLHPTDFVFRFTPELKWMWPQRNEGVPGIEWVAPDPHSAEAADAPEAQDGAALPHDRSSSLGSGFYVLHADYPDLAAAVTIPGALPGVLAPYQERPQVHPVELKLHIDPTRDRDRLYPLLMAVGTDPASATNAALAATLQSLNRGLPGLYAAHAARYQKLLASTTTIETPDPVLDEAFRWAAVSIEQLKTRTQRGDETALVAGYYASADSARPGFGWFFGRDALYTLYAVNGFGDFALTRAELEFLIRRQRADGKIMHEYSQTAANVDWLQFPYLYAAADATPLFLLAMADYVRASGDLDFLRSHKEAVEKAWAFETDPAHDTDHDGIYDNSQGTGWVESWVEIRPGSPTSHAMPHQEIYLALLDRQASEAMAWLSNQLGNPAIAQAATARAASLLSTIEQEYSDRDKGCYAFSHNSDGSQDRTTTIYPALAWWSGTLVQPLAHGDQCLRQFVSAALDTDWGTRDVSDREAIYDGMSYHQGSVWPLFTGWAALAEYRGNQPLAGYRLLRQNAGLTRAQDLGAVTELLSGDFFVPFGRSTSHQLWSSAMVVTPTLRGLFGLSIDATTKIITVNPHLPAQWNRASIRNVALPFGLESIEFERQGSTLLVRAGNLKSKGWTLRSDLPGTSSIANSLSSEGLALAIPQPDVEIETPGDTLPEPGSRTAQPRILSQQYGHRSLTLVVEGQAGQSASLNAIRRKLLPSLRIDSPQNTGFIDSAAQDASAPVRIGLNFPPGQGWQTLTVTLSW